MTNKLDFGYWKELPETKKTIQDIDEELDRNKDEVLNGYLMTSSALDKEYCRAIGFREGLLFAQRLLKVEENIDD